MIKKILALGFAIIGLMLTLAGVNLIALSQNFMLYTGVFLLLLAIVLFFIGNKTE